MAQPANANAPNGETHITAEPLFYGDSRHHRGVTAEDFVTKLRTTKAALVITDQHMVARAVGYLRESAADWWHKGLGFMNAEGKTEATTDFETFVNLFKKRFFKVATFTDLSGDYSALRQRSDESSADFMWRAAAAFSTHASLRPEIELTHQAQEAFRAAIIAFTNEVLQLEANDYDNIPDDLKDGIWLAARNLWRRGVQAERTDLLGDIGTKVACQGIRNPKHQEMIRKLEREGKNFSAIADALQEAEKDAANRPPPGIIPRTTIPAIIKAADAHEDDEDDEVQAEVAAAKKQANGKGKKAKKAKAQQAQQKQGGGFNSLPQQQKGGNNGNGKIGLFHTTNPRFNNFNSNPRVPNRPCSHCQNEYNTDPAKWHWDNKCPNAPKNKGSMSAGGEINADANAASFNNHLN
jgi:hypothetical protein